MFATLLTLTFRSYASQCRISNRGVAVLNHESLRINTKLKNTAKSGSLALDVLKIQSKGQRQINKVYFKYAQKIKL